jgi:hypothetical protein
MTTPPAHDTRLERILGAPLAHDAMRQWPQSGEVINGRASTKWSPTSRVSDSRSADAMHAATPSWSSGAPTTA